MSKNIYNVVSFVCLKGFFFSTSDGKCAPGKKSLRIHYIGIQAKILLSPCFQTEISCLWCRTPKSYCTTACLTLISSVSRPKSIHLSSKVSNITAHLGLLEGK